ncbi:MAG: hypothetical protein WBJ10_08840 [Daejeonella sp.]|uniref:hypothetical protein n=1 Tax=Daejeonella sp. TaxID=2805397 RepID=UPI003C70AE09
MKNTDPNYTDNFFRQGLSTPPVFSPSEENWKEMERLLKKKARRRLIPWTFALSGAAAAILIFIFLWPGLEKIASEKPQEQKAGTTEITSENKKQTERNDDALNPPGDFRSRGDELASIRTNPVVKENVLPEGNSDITSSSKGLSSGIVASLNTVAADFNVLNDARFLTLQPRISENFGKDPVIGIQALPSETSAAGTSDEDEKISSGNASKWALNMALSPDVNTVNNMGKGDLGLSMGLGLSYNVKPAISLSTGIYYSLKQYSADKTSYNVTEKPFATWTSYAKQIDADCRVIDIRLNLNFRIRNKSNNKLYASAGISSYIMLSEKYEFVYNPSPAYPTGRRGYTVRDENKHILNIVNLAVALEKPIGKQVSLVIQPYAKLPLTGIGKGQTDLKSVGIGFGVNYSVKKK